MGPRKRKKKRQAGRQSSHFARKCVQQTCRNTPPRGVDPTYFLPGVGGFSPITRIELEQSGALVVSHYTPTSLLYALGPTPPWEKQWERATEGNRLESDYPTQIGHFEETAL